MMKIKTINLKTKIYSFYLKFLSVLYFLGFFLHLLDVFNLRLSFTEMTPIWKAWIVFLFIFDLITSIGLWTNKNWGIFSFLFVASIQIIAYSFFKHIWGDQHILVTFHILALALFLILNKTARVSTNS